MQIEDSNDRAITKFARIAKRYCEWAETISSDRHSELAMVRTLLAELHLTMLALSIPEGTNAILIDDVWRDEKLWLNPDLRFGHLLPEGYWETADPLDEEEVVIQGSLADNLGDIYRDLKRGLLLFEQGAIAEAVWEWRFNFDIHWGDRLVSAQRVIHYYFG